MKPGDKFPVNLNEHIVAEAVVIDIEDGKVTLDIPATRIVMGVKSSLTDLPETTPDVEHQILGAEDRVTGSPPSVPQAPNTQDATGANVPPPVEETTVPTSTLPADSANALPPDAIGEGLANVELKEID